jgi:hypothetical protein
VSMLSLSAPAWTSRLSLGAHAWNDTLGLDGILLSCFILSLNLYPITITGLLDELVIWNRALSATGVYLNGILCLVSKVHALFGSFGF